MIPNKTPRHASALSWRMGVGCVLFVLCLLSACQRKLSLLGGGSGRAPMAVLDIKGRLRYRDNGGDFSSPVTVRIRQDSLIWFSASPVLGIEAFRGVVQDDTVSLLNRIDKTYYVYAYEELRDLLGTDIGVSYPFVESLFLGRLPFRTRGFARRQTAQGKVQWEGLYRDFQCRLVMHEAYDALSLLEARHRQGHLLRVNYHYDEPAAKGLPLTMPSKVVILWRFRAADGEEKKLEIQFSRGRTTVMRRANAQFPFKIPDKYVSGR